MGEKVRELRENLSMTQQDVADKMCELGYVYTREAVSMVETGKVKTIDAPTLYGFAKALKTTPDYLMGENLEPGTVYIGDEDMRDFFAGDWDSLDDLEKEWVRHAIRFARERLAKNNEKQID